MRRRARRMPAWIPMTSILVVLFFVFFQIRVTIEARAQEASAHALTQVEQAEAELQAVKSRENELQKQLEEKERQLDEVRKFKTTPQSAFLETEIFPCSDKYGIPRQLVAAQWAIESGRAMYRDDNNHFGLGPGMKFGSICDAVKVYAKSLRTIVARKSADFDELKQNPYEILVRLQEGSYRYEAHSPDPQHYIQLVSSMPEWRVYEGR